MEEYYRDLDLSWCQGDIIRKVPHIYLKQPPLTIARRESTSRYGERLTPYLYDFGISEGEESANTSLPGGFKFDRGEQSLALCHIAFGMILTNGCEIDKDDKHRTMALIRPLNVVQDGQDIIRANKNFSYFYLPAYGAIMGESYVDFRRITTLHPDFLKDAERVVSLTDDAVKGLQMQFFRFLTRRSVSPEALDQLPIIP